MRFVTLLLLFLYANLSLALGLGDAELKSNLGERFLAKIDVTDVDSPPESSCFNATDISDTPAFRKLSVNLKANNNGNYQLTITSNEVITEPIVNLRISLHCEPNINREYVLLLDPAPLPAIQNASSGEISPNAEPSLDDAKKQNRKSHQASIKNSPTAENNEQAYDDEVSAQPTLKKVAKKKKSKSISAVDEKLLEAYTGKQRANSAAQSSAATDSKNNVNSSAPHQSADKPFLVISAGNANVNEGINKPGLSLRLATEIDVTRPDEVAAPAAQSATDTMDEVTVMSNRLAHLEKQIVSLQTRNAQLVTEAQNAKEKSESFDWLQFLKITLGILVALSIIELLRRKLSNSKTHATDTWFNNDEPAAFSKPSNLSVNLVNEFDSNNIHSASFDEPNFIEPPAQNFNTANAQTLAVAEKEEHISIMEDADVFIEHGRPALAIQLLQNHLSESPSESPAIWLKLLNLLSKEGTETEYDTAVVECNKHFNIKAAKYGNGPVSDEASIEDYPHIVSRLEGVWGSPYAIGFLNDLIFNKRSQPREGLNQGAFNDLFFLKNIAKNLEHANPSIFKVSPEPSAYKTSTSEESVVATNIENTQFNDALFTDIEPPAEASAKAKSKLNDTKRGTKSNFNSFDDETSYEVNIIPNDEVPEENSTPQNGKVFRVEAIDFSMPVEKVEYATGAKVYDLTEEIVLSDSDKVANKNHDFSLDFPNEFAPKQKSAKEKTKSKNKTKPSIKNQSESNEIEWDLPLIEPESDK